jgi:AhpD family alkylhydroperoxidase
MQLEECIARLIGVGASVAGNCQACLDANAKKAFEAGADPSLIAEAITIGKLVRQGAASSMDAFLSELEASVNATEGEGLSCNCGMQRRAS